jgi:biotin carboxyl carrier protein
MRYITTIGDQEYLIEILDEQNLLVNGVRFHIDFESISQQPVYSLLLDGQSYESYVYAGEDALQVFLHGSHYQATVEDEREKRLRSASRGNVAENAEFQLRAPMPGLVVAIPVKDGQTVNKGDVLVVLESMKMQNELKSPRSGTISRMRIKIGDSVELKQTLLSVM